MQHFSTRYLLALPGILLMASCNLTAPRFSPVTVPPFQPSTTPTYFALLTPSTIPILPPYRGAPFSIVFVRDENLWVVEIGGEEAERRLTFEPKGIRIADFSISPDETQIAYISYRVDPLYSLVKIVRISNGETRIIHEEKNPDPGMIWLDNAKIAYTSLDKTGENFSYVIYDLATQSQISKTEYTSIRPSPNGQYWLTCSSHVELCSYSLQNLSDGSTEAIGPNLGWSSWPLAWSPDSKFILFRASNSPDDCTARLALVNPETLEEKFITPEDMDIGSAGLSPSGNMVAYEQSAIVDPGICLPGKEEYWLMNLHNYETTKIPTHFMEDVWDIGWTPDGKRLIFFYDNYSGGEGKNLWSIKLDGSDLSLLLSNVHEYRVLYSKP